MKKGCYIILLCCLGWLSVFAAPPATTMTVNLPADITLQKQLDKNAIHLQTITSQVQQENNTEKLLSSLQQEVADIIVKIQLTQSDVEKKIANTNDLINTLGPAPKNKEAVENEITATKRTELTKQLALYEGQMQQASMLSTQANSLYKSIVQQRLAQKAKGLMYRTLPLYSPLIWVQGWNKTDYAFSYTKQNILTMFKNSIVALDNKTMIITFSALLLGIILTTFVLGWLLVQRFGRRYITASPNFFLRTTTTLANLIAKALLPMIALLVSIGCFEYFNIINEQQAAMLIHLALTLSAIIFTYFAVNLILAPKLSAWRILTLPDKKAILLARQLFIFITLIILNWSISTAKINLPADFLIPCLFLLRAAACLSGLILLKTRYWSDELLAQQKDTPSSSLTAQLIFLRWVRVTSFVIFISNPVIMLFGYVRLANFMFISFMQTLALVVLLLGLHIASHQILGKLLHIKSECEGDNHLELTDKSHQFLHYWLIVIIDLFFLMVAIITILLAWGLSYDELWRLVKPILYGFNLGHYHFSLITFSVAFLTFFAFFIGTRILQHFLNRRVFPYMALDIGVKHALHQGIGYVGITIGFLVSIGMIGINLTSLALIAGALSVGIGFGLQNIVSNFIAGIIVLVERPIKIGDRIIVGQDEGMVKRISVRATELEAADGSSVLIPNSELISGRVRNWTFRNPLTKVDVLVSVAYGTDTRQVEKLLLQLAEQNQYVTRSPAPSVSFTNFGASSLDFRLSVGLYDFDKRTHVSSELRHAIEQCFREHHIEMPYPHYDVKLVQ